MKKIVDFHLVFSKKRTKQFISSFLIVAWLIAGWPQINFGGYSFPPKNIASAAEAVIISAAYDVTMQYSSSPSTVFTTSLIGYHFYVNSSNDVVYASTTDSGATWSSEVSIDPDTPNVLWTTVAVWFDQWTPGDTSGTKIHIVAVNSTTGDEDVYYHYLDTSNNTLRSGGWSSAILGTAYDPGADGNVTITKSTDGDLYLAASGTFGAASTRVYNSTNGGDNWSNSNLTLTNGLDDLDTQQLLPLYGGDILVIVCDATQNKLVSKELYNNDTWGTEQNIDTAFFDATAYDDNFGATIYKDTGDVYLAASNGINTTANDLKFYKFSESSRTWTTKTDILSNSIYAVNVRPIVDQSNGDIYVTYLYGAIGADTNVYYKKSIDDGMSWSPQSVQINDTTDDHRTISTNFMNYPGDILYAVWENDDTNAIRGVVIPKDITTSPLPNASQIDITVADATDENNPSPNTVFIDANNGYVFYVDATTLDVSYARTDDGGETWSAPITMGVNPVVTWSNLAVWYDQWTPGDNTGTKIHIAAVNDTVGDEDIYYNYLDTSDDSIGASGWQLAIATTAWTVNANAGPSITKATDGDIFISAGGTIDAVNKIVVYSCTGYPISCADTSLSATSGLANGDFNQLLPLSSADIMIIIQDVSVNKMISIEYADSSSTWVNELTIDSSIVENTTYDGQWGAAIYKSTNDVYIAANNAINNAAGDIELYKFVDSSRASWTAISEVISNVQHMAQANIAIDQNTGDLYVTYVKGGTLNVSTDIYFKASLDDGVTWGGETQLNTVTDDLKYVRTNFMNADRLVALWYNDDLNDIVMNSMGIARFDQAAYKWFSNSNSLVVASALAAQDTAATLTTIGDQFRLRLLLNAGISVVPTNTHHLKLQYAVKSGTCDTSFSGELYTDVSTSTGDIRFYDNSDGSTVSGADMQNSDADPTDGARTIIRENYYEENPFSNDREGIFRGRDGKWDLSLVDYSAPSKTSYCFRVVRENGNVLNSYTVIPEITTASPAASITLDTDGTIDYGVLPLNSTQDNSVSGVNDVQTVTVGTSTADLLIKSSVFDEGSDTWSLESSNGPHKVVWEYSSSTSDYQKFTVPDANYIFDINVPSSTSRNIYLRLTLPTVTNSYNSYSTNVTITAVSP